MNRSFVCLVLVATGAAACTNTAHPSGAGHPGRTSSSAGTAATRSTRPGDALGSTASCDSSGPTIDRVWQVAGPREPVSEGSDLEIGLRNKMAPGNYQEPVDPNRLLAAPDVALTVRVVAPDASIHTGPPLRLLPAPPDAWISVVYPRDFSGAGTTGVGDYTVVWSGPGGVLVCDHFRVVSRSAS